MDVHVSDERFGPTRAFGFYALKQTLQGEQIVANGRSVARGGDAVAIARAEIASLREGLDRIEAALGRVGADSASPRDRPDRYYRVLVDVYEHGRHGLPSAQFAPLGRALGYDARGLGGFFVGTRAPLRRGEDRVLLTTEGHRLVEEYLGGVRP